MGKEPNISSTPANFFALARHFANSSVAEPCKTYRSPPQRSKLFPSGRALDPRLLHADTQERR